MAPAFAAAGVAFEVDAPSGPVPARLDPARVQQMIGNLLSNAAKYTPRGGRARLRVARPRRDRHPCRGQRHRRRARDARCDLRLVRTGGADGHGSQRGLGIGLSLVRRLAELHGGTATAHSDGLGAGSTFEIRLPRARAAFALAPTAGRPVPDARPRRVLVVDDDPDNAEALVAVSPDKGPHPRLGDQRRSGGGGCPAAAPDVVLLDIGLPGIDGYETCRQLRRAVSGLSSWRSPGGGSATTGGARPTRASTATSSSPRIPDAVLALVESAPVLATP